jgi:mediator of RNA polymerase II transcription subunit 10
MKDIVQSLYNLIVQGYDHQGAVTISAMRRDMYGKHSDN